MSPTITTRCATEACDGEVVFSRAHGDGPVTGTCPRCAVDWRLSAGRLAELASDEPVA